MTSIHTELPRGRTLTAYDVAELWTQEHRLELIDGILSELAPASFVHQRAQARLLKPLFAAETDDVEIFAAPFDILSEDTAVQPDILVVDRADVADGKHLEAIPLLVVEVLSPSTALRDLNTKFKRYERAGIQSYWVVDPIEPRLIAWELADGSYAEAANIGPDETWTAPGPLPITITPRDLIR